MGGDAERATVAAFVAGAVLAGGNAVGVRYSNRELDPLWGAGFRFALAALLFLFLLAALRVPIPRGRPLAGAVLYGVLQFGATFALAYYALVELHAGFGQILLALVPLLTLLLAFAEGQERLRAAAIVGTVLALAGAAYSFVLIPIVTVGLSAWLDDEPVGLGLVAGGALVLAGVYVGALRRPPATG